MKYRNNSFLAFLVFVGLSGLLILTTGVVNCNGLLFFTNGVVNCLLNMKGLLSISTETQAITTLLSLFLMACAAWVIWEDDKRYNSPALIWYYISIALLFIQQPALLMIHRLIPFTVCLIFALCISKTFVLFYKQNKLAAFLIFPITLLSFMSAIAVLHMKFDRLNLAHNACQQSQQYRGSSYR